jgi:hypothetical protein
MRFSTQGFRGATTQPNAIHDPVGVASRPFAVVRALLLASLAAVASHARADESELLRAQINAVRLTVIALTESPEQRTPQRMQDLAALVEKVDGRMATMQAPKQQTTNAPDLRAAWLTYRTTLLTQVVPALQSGQAVGEGTKALAPHRHRIAQALKTVSPPRQSQATSSDGFR